MSGQVRGGAAPVTRNVLQGDNCRQGGANLRFGALPGVAFPALSPVLAGAASVGWGGDLSLLARSASADFETRVLCLFFIFYCWFPLALGQQCF